MKRAYLYVIIAGSLGATGGIFIKMLHELTPTTVAFFRFALPAVLIGIYFLYKKIQPFRKRYGWMFLVSVLNAVRILLVVSGFLLISLGTAHTMLFTFPIFIAVLGIIFLKEKIDISTLFFLLTAFAGVIIIYSSGNISLSNEDFLGITFILLAALTHAVSVIILKHEIDLYTPVEAVFHQSLIGSLIFLPFFILSIPSISMIDYGFGISYGFIVGLLTWIFYFTALKHMKASHWSILAYWEVPIAIFYGFIFFKEPVTIQMIIGALFIIGSGIGLIITKYKKQKSNT